MRRSFRTEAEKQLCWEALCNRTGQYKNRGPSEKNTVRLAGIAARKRGLPLHFDELRKPREMQLLVELCDEYGITPPSSPPLRQ